MRLMRSRLVKWIFRICGIAGVSIAALLAFAVAVLPGLVQQAALRKLAEMGLTGASLEVRSISLRGLEAANIALDDKGRVRIGSLSISYDTASLRSRAVKVIEVTGAEVELKVRNGVLDLGPFAQIQFSSEAGELPFERAEVHSSALIIDLDGRTMRVPCYGSVTNLGGGRVELKADLYAEAAAIRVSGTVDTNTRDADLTATATAAELAGLVPRGPVRCGGRGQVKAQYTRVNGKGKASIAVTIADAWAEAKFAGHRLDAEGLSAKLEAGLDGALRVSKFESELRTGSVTFDGEAATGVVASASKQDEEFVFEATASGEGWKLKQIVGKVTGLFGWVANATADLAAEASWTVEGRLPRRAAELLRARGVLAEALGLVTVNGKAAVRLSKAAAGWTWQAEVLGARVDLAPGDLSVPAVGLLLRGVSGEAQIAGKADANGLSLKLLPGSELVADGVEMDYAGVQIPGQGGVGPSISAGLGQQAAEVAVSFHDGLTSWRVEATEVRIGFGLPAVSVAAGPCRIEGLNGLLLARVTAEPGEMAVWRRIGSFVACNSLEAAVGGEVMRVDDLSLYADGDQDEPMLAVATGPEGFAASIAGEARTCSPVTVRLGDGSSATLQGISLDAIAEITQKDPSAKAELVIERIDTKLCRKLSGQAASVSSQGGRLQVSLEGISPLRARFAASTGSASGAFGPVEARLANAEASGSLGLGPDGKPACEARIALKQASASHKASGVALSDINAEVPVSLNRLPAAMGSFTAGSVAYKNAKLPPVSGTIRLTDARADFAANWPFLKGATLAAAGWLDAGGAVRRGELTASVSRFEFDDENQPATLLPAAGDLDVRGTFSLDARLNLLGNRIDPLVRVVAENASVKSAKYDAALEGVNAVVTVDSFAPLSTPGNQRIEVKRGHIGKLQVLDGSTALRVESPRSILIERTEWGWADGRLYSYGFRIDPMAPAIDVVAYGDHLSLKEILALIPNERATGEGRLYGRLPVTIRWPNLSYGNGFLYATPGVGWLRLSKAEIIGDLLEQGDSRFRTDQKMVEVKKRTVEALKDFEYSVLKVDFINREGGLSAAISTAGRGRLGVRQEFSGINLNLHGIDRILNEQLIIPR